jgi:hypothetical protein
MGQFKSRMMQDEQDSDLKEFLSNLLKKEELQVAIEGITKQVIDKGVDSMSEIQRNTINNFVDGYKKKHPCKRCTNDNVSSLSDYIEIADEKLCPICQYELAQLEKD